MADGSDEYSLTWFLLCYHRVINRKTSEERISIMTLSLYRVSQGYKGYDKYDSAVVAAESAEDAKTIHPSGLNWTYGSWEWTQSWTEPENVSVDYLGAADESLERGVICASFNAG